MNFFSALIGEETNEELKCFRCGDRPNIVQVMLDPCTNTGAVSAFGTI